MKVVAVVLALLMTSACGDGRTEARLTGYRTVQPDTLVVELDSCNRDPVLTHLEETATEVRISVERDHLVGWLGQSSCLDVVDLELDEALGNRDLVDAATGATVRRRDG